jgi:hypothetical protein
MKDLTIWTVYHRDEQVEQYGLQEARRDGSTALTSTIWGAASID